MSPADEYVGPLTPAPEQLEPVIALANRAFYSNKPFTIMDEFPLMFCPESLGRLRIFTKDSQPVAHAATTINKVAALGCRPRVACLGAVCTDEAHRGRGLAGRLVDDAVARAQAQGAAVILISGHRSLYQRRGAHKVGRFLKYTVPADSIPQRDDLTIAELAPQDCRQALQLFQDEPVHFCRTLDQYTSQTSTGFVMNRKGKSYAVRRGNELSAVVTVWYSRPGAADAETGIVTVEFAGSRQDLLSALPKICREFNAGRAEIIGYNSDQSLLDACRPLGLEPQTVPFDFVVKLLDAQRLWQDFQPLLTERIGTEALSNLGLSAESDRMQIHSLTFRLGSQTLTIQGAEDVLAALFGSPQSDPLAGAEGELGRILRQALPLPLPMYGLNFL